MRGRRVPFSPTRLVAGFGAAWAADSEHPLIVRISPGRLDGEIAAVFGTDDPPSPGRGPLAVVAGLGSIWALPAGGTRLVQVDPESGATRSRELPFALGDLCAGPKALFGIGPTGDGRVARIEPDGGVTEAGAGRALALVAAAGDLVWTVDDEAGRVLALDGGSLELVAEFEHLGGPEALVAAGSRAWYLARPEAEHTGPGGRRERAVIVTGDGLGTDLLRFDARAGSRDRLGRRPEGSPSLALDDERLWISGLLADDVTAVEDPTSGLECVDLDGRGLLRIERPGQIDAMAAGDGAVWVSGFRRSQQAHLTTMLRGDGQVLGQVSFASVDLRPFTPPPPPRGRRVTPMARAQAIRDDAEQDLSQPQQATGRFGDSREEPPVSEEFRLERVEVRGTDRAPQIAVLFRWAGEDDLLGLTYEVARRGDTYISVYVAEDLLGRGVDTAVREVAGGVTWLSWPER